MSDPSHSNQTPLGLYAGARNGGLVKTDIIAAVVAVVWLLATGMYFFFSSWSVESAEATLDGPVRAAIILLAMVLPVMMVMVAAACLRAEEALRREALRVQSLADTLSHAAVQAQAQVETGSNSPTAAPHSAGEATVARKLEDIAKARGANDTRLAPFTTSRADFADPPSGPASFDAGDGAHTSGPAPNADDPAEAQKQADLPLSTEPVEHVALSHDDFVRALNFPLTADDREGFAALRRALRLRETARIIQASEDVLTLLSQDGIYMDDLEPERSRPELWRRFAAGERGRQVAALGGIRDRSCLALTAARMKQDAIFRDAVHHFLRLFDQTLSRFCETASDAEISAMSDTRSARAFMLVGRAAGTFD